ncbi:hypothetical protein [Confluentibacter sediminis]|uniref:hypothetical protein n=1 Tax=Confluentibacter sediminis TaxID=2219045 RepID=UPI000DAE35FE|nr:hypothetical protein [Confluentibacter sediminis]
MNTLLIEVNDLGWLILLMLFLAFGVPLILIITGIALRNKNKSTSKKLFIAAVVYVLIGLGVCGVLLTNI